MIKNDKRILAIIPARGGSKRIPQKNIIPFLGQPLIVHTIYAAKESQLFDKIVVSTDDQEIMDVSQKYGAEVPFLRDTHADDYSPVSEATLRTIQQLEDAGEFFDDVIQLFAVCPLRNATDITKAYSFFEEQKAPFVLSCFKYAWMNPWWAMKIDPNHHGEWIFKTDKTRSQDLPELFSPTGAIWIANIEALKQSKTFYGEGHLFWELNWKRAVDIDNYDDLELAAALSTIA